MREELKNIDLYFITDSKLTKKTVIEDVKAALKAGVKIIQYREKEKNTAEMIKEAQKIAKLCKENNALFIINDRVDVALTVDADGVHLGDDDMPCHIARKILGNNKIIGLTVHNIKEAIEAERAGADYIGLSPIFETLTKSDAGMPAGLEFIKEVKEKIKIPFVAIGGINETNIEEVIRAGAKSTAIISAIVTKPDVEKECKKFRKIISDNYSKTRYL
ncbi:MAG: thiamine phosphate synthase [Actinomycetota bacterium]|nr:thiamine phosphate synthase [Actinomycetota bacterium]